LNQPTVNIYLVSRFPPTVGLITDVSGGVGRLVKMASVSVFFVGIEDLCEKNTV
jgi:hypothetical protein